MSIQGGGAFRTSCMTDNLIGAQRYLVCKFPLHHSLILPRILQRTVNGSVPAVGAGTGAGTGSSSVGAATGAESTECEDGVSAMTEYSGHKSGGGETGEWDEH